MSKELHCSWLFGPESGADDGPNDALAENFNSRPIVSLVRESIQNSLDAAPENSTTPVRVEYSFGLLPLNEMENFTEIREHIAGCLSLYKDNDNAKEFFPPMLSYIDLLHGHLPYIKVSDYNTTGMNYIDDFHTKEPFYAYVRSKGVTAKRSSSSGGSFGFGKAAYYGMSKIKTIMVYTQTDQGKTFFEGISSLCTHILDDGHDGKLSAVGYYDNNEGYPIDDRDMIPEIFVRPEVLGSGTDFWIMGYDTFQKPTYVNEMIMATLRSFWLSIYKGELEVLIDGSEINSDNLGDYLCRFFPENSDKQSSTRDNFNPRPYYEAVIHDNEKDNPKFHCITKTLPILGEVKLYAYLHKNASNKVLLTRKPKMLVQLKNVSPIGIYGVFICENEEGNIMLKSMENPAHTLWIAGKKKETRTAYQELENFLSETISSLKPKSGKKSIQIIGLSDLAWIPETLIQEETDSEEDSEAEGLKLRDELTDEEKGNQVAEILYKKISTRTAVKKKAKVQEIFDGEKDGEDDESQFSDSFGGPTDKSRKPTVEPGKRPPFDKGTGEGQFPGPDPEGKNRGNSKAPSRKRKATDVRLRQNVQIEGGEVVHKLTIYPPYDIKDANLTLLVGRDNGFEIQPIKSAFSQNQLVGVEGSTLQHVQLFQKGTVIKIKFFDNIKHSLRLIVEDESN